MPRSARTPSFARRVVRWQRDHGRSNLPWQATRDAYRIWLSEIMLQQTQVSTVIPYFERFVARFPDAAALAAAPEDEVMALWSGLGYYARARNLHRAARDVVERFAGVFPARFHDLVTLPGIGRSTAGAIAAFASGEARPILDGNVRRVLARHAGIPGDPTSNAVQKALWEEAEARMPRDDVEAYTQGMMDLGATVCLPRKPLCLLCPVNEDCTARLEDRIDELPGRKVRGATRRKRVAMLVVVSRGEVLLEKRPRAASGAASGRCRKPMRIRSRKKRCAQIGGSKLRASSRSRRSSTRSRISRSKSRRGASSRAGRWLLPSRSPRRGCRSPISPARRCLHQCASCCRRFKPGTQSYFACCNWGRSRILEARPKVVRAGCRWPHRRDF